MGEVTRVGLSHDPFRYAAACVRPSTPFPNLFLSGTDLTYDSFLGGFEAGYLTATGLLGYNAVDLLYLGKNAVSDLDDGKGGVIIAE